MRDILDKDYKHYEDVIRDLQINFYPECTIVKPIEWTKGMQKYEWFGTFVFEYFNTLYLVSIRATGNGGWLGIDDCKVLNIAKVKKTTKNVVIETYEEIN